METLFCIELSNRQGCSLNTKGTEKTVEVRERERKGERIRRGEKVGRKRVWRR